MFLQQAFEGMGRLERHRGHFYNWYDTRTMEALAPLYVSTVDSGNLAASLVAVKQGCLELAGEPLIGRQTLESLRDHCVLFRDSLPFDRRHATIMNLVGSALKQCDSKPTDLFYWESVLTDLRAIVGRLREPLDRLGAEIGEASYWYDVLKSRVEIALNDLYALAPWLAPPLEDELRMASNALPDLVAMLCRISTLRELPAHIRQIEEAIGRRLEDPRPLPRSSFAALERLRSELPAAEMNASRLLEDFERQAALASRWVDEMDFRFLFDRRRKLLHIGYDPAADKLDSSYYDLLASEARAAVFLAIAKGEIPREAWFRLGRRLVSHRGRRALVSWSGTMFEYLMPALFMKTYSQTLIGQSMQTVIAIQQHYGREHGVPWGVSEAACSERDHALNYQYRAFGLPALAADQKSARGLVVAPYASMLAAMVDKRAAEQNLRRIAENGWLTRHGFYESADYSNGRQPVEVVRSHMVHHQGMGLIALANALLGSPMQERFHADPMVQATEYLLQERLQALIDVTPVLAAEPARHPKPVVAGVTR